MRRPVMRFVLLPLSLLPALGTVAFIAVPGVFAALRSQAAAPPQFGGMTLVLNLVGLALFVLTVIALVPVMRQSADSDSGFVAALVATAALIPLTVTELIVVAAYIAPAKGFPGWITGIRDNALFWGALTGLVTWAIVGVRYRNFGTVRQQNARVYAELCQQYTQLRSRLGPLIESLDASAANAPGSGAGQAARTAPMVASKAKLGARAEAENNLNAVGAQLGLNPDGTESAESPRPALRWVLATGYIALWNRLHRAEEAIIVLEEPGAVVSGAVYDYMRVQGSAIPARDELLAKIHWAVNVISPSDAETLTPLTITTTTGGTVKVQFTPQPKRFRFLPFASRGNAPAPKDSAEQAQLVLREVRRSIDEYRDNSWAELVRQRNRMVETMIILRVAAFILLAVAVIIKVPVHTVIAVVAFYLVGASVGLFNRLNAQPKPEDSHPVEDYGLTSMSLLEAVLFAGLAAVGGVVITGLLTVSLAKVMAPTAQAQVPQLATVLDVGQNKIGFIIAAVFGLTPQLLLNRVLEITQQYKSAIGNSEPSQVKGATSKSQ